MANNFVRMVYAFLIDKGVDTSRLTPKEAIDLFKQMQEKEQKNFAREQDEQKLRSKGYTSKIIDSLSDSELRVKVDKFGASAYNYVGVMRRVKSFAGKEEGTYDYQTGELLNLTDGYMVTFHQNEPDAEGHYKSHYGRYTEAEYDKLTNEFAKDNDAQVFIGNYDGEPEVTFKVKTFEQAIKLAEKYNQEAIWDNKKGSTGDFEGAKNINPHYNTAKNPMRGN